MAARATGHAAGGNRRGTFGGVAIGLGLLVLTTVLTVGPLMALMPVIARSAAADWTTHREATKAIVSPQVLASTGAYAIGIGVVATALAVPAAAVLARSPRRRAWLAIIATPLLLPNYLAYSGWGLLRGPNTSLGDWLGAADPWWSIAAGRITAVIGLALWLWPLAALVMAGPLRRAAALDEAMRLEAPRHWQRAWAIAGATRGGIAAAIGLVVLITLGSAIPLHVAQAPTWAIEVWKAMQLSPNPAGAWLAALPLIAIAGLAAGVVVRAWLRVLDEAGHSDSAPDRRSAAASGGTVVVWAAAVVAPMLLYLWSLNSWRSIPMFWRISGAGVAQGLKLAAIVGAVGVLIAGAVWASADRGGRWGRRAALGATVLLTAAGLAPGVLVGAAAASLGARPGGWLTETAMVAAVHIARFGYIGALGGWWLASLEPLEQRWNRDLDGGSWRAWVMSAVRPQSGALAGMGLAMGALSLHEIESTVFVLPPGLANLPQQLLDYLHYARDEQLSAAAFNLLAVGLVIAGTAAALVARSWRPGKSNVQRVGDE